MLVIKNKSNAVIELGGVRIYPGDNKLVNIGYTSHIQNLENLRIISVNKINENYISNDSQESQVEDPKSSVQDENVEIEDRIDVSRVTDSITIEPDNNKSSSSKKKRSSTT